MRRLKFCCCLLIASAVQADDVDRTTKVPTLGGVQFWSDHFVHGDWRIQKNVLTGHYRLLDHRDFRRASGSYAECQKQFQRLQEQLETSPPGRKVVLVVHGLGRSRQSMSKMVAYLRKQSDYRVLNVSYASTRTKIADHAGTLATLINNLSDVDEISFVAHSMGNLVIRHYLHDLLQDTSRRKEVDRIKRIVMLAPPNQGATLADRFRSSPVFRVVWGTTGAEIADWSSLEPRLAIPPVEFGIVAGGNGDHTGRNPLIPGDDDFVVAVSETRLVEAHDFAVLPTMHAVIMDNAAVQEYTLRFLQNGYFVAADQRNPISGEP